VNCAALPENLLESELFGYERGAFTGADRKRGGLFEQADSGTIFLDEIGEMHLNLQAKLLRAIETKSFIPLGARKPVTVDVRVVAATNRDLQVLAQEGRFRPDLYYRIGVITIKLLRLAERPEDILPIVARTLRRVSGDVSFDPEATDLLLRYSWPGNVRELLNFLQRLLLAQPQGTVDRETVTDLLDRHGTTDRNLPVATGISTEESGYRLVYQALLNLANEVVDLKRMLSDFIDSQEETFAETPVATGSSGELAAMEKNLIREALDRFHGNRRQAAAHLGIGERTLYRKLKKYNLK
jgi:transcriptional regulator with PAS, ATPase and Fis domain